MNTLTRSPSVATAQSWGRLFRRRLSDGVILAVVMSLTIMIFAHMSESVPGEAVIGLVGFFFAAGIGGAALVAGIQAWFLARSEAGRCRKKQA